MTSQAELAGYVSEVFVSFQGEGSEVGKRHLFVRLAGCNMRCVYCDTPDSLERTSSCRVQHQGRTASCHDNPLSSGALVAVIEELIREEGPIDAISMTGGEPLIQAAYVAEVLRRLAGAVPILLETNGVLSSQLRQVVDLVDMISMDMKPPSNTGEREFWDDHADFLQVASRAVCYVKLLIDEGTDEGEVERAASLLAEGGGTSELYLQPITGEDGKVAISGEKLTMLYHAARRRHDAVRILPQTHRMLGIS